MQIYRMERVSQPLAQEHHRLRAQVPHSMPLERTCGRDRHYTVWPIATLNDGFTGLIIGQRDSRKHMDPP
jgi:hypothetical protein